MLTLDALPRTIALVRAGEEGTAGLDEAAASAVASFVAEVRPATGVPMAVMLDQRALPGAVACICTDDWMCVIDAICALAVRGAPAIGIAGAAALALRAWQLADAVEDAGAPGAVGDAGQSAHEQFLEGLRCAAKEISAARPTAVNLRFEVDAALAEAEEALDAGESPRAVADALCVRVQRLVETDERICRAIGRYGAALIEPGSRILTHCNAGSLATAFYGTALGVVYAAAEQGKVERVYADETRPVGQGARLTVWELSRAGVPVTLICDDMAAAAMAAGLIDAVVVGADRIAANGDVANKIGTLGVAVLAHRFGIPFYVAAPRSTIDLATPDGASIPIEERAAEEVLPAPIPSVDVWNPAFDVTPAELVSAIITEEGVLSPGELARRA